MLSGPLQKKFADSLDLKGNVGGQFEGMEREIYFKIFLKESVLKKASFKFAPALPSPSDNAGCVVYMLTLELGTSRTLCPWVQATSRPSFLGPHRLSRRRNMGTGEEGTAMSLPALRLGGHRMGTQPPRPSHRAKWGKGPSVFPSQLLSPYKTAQAGMSYRQRRKMGGKCNSVFTNL